MCSLTFTLILCLAILTDFVLGDSIRVAKIPHPVILIGRVINFLEHKISARNFKSGLLLCSLTLIITELVVWSLMYLSDLLSLGIIFQLYLLYAALAWRDLKDETMPVYEHLLKENIFAARKALSLVVGRDTEFLSGNEISRAAVETIAENSVDGIFSVMFYAAVGYAINKNFGIGIFVWLFKTASTLDSIIGYERYGDFGKAGAKLDDVLNFIPARLGGLVIILAGGLAGCNIKEAFTVFIRDRKKHKSPNSAHGESAFAGVLGVRLGGGAFYNGIYESRPQIGNESSREPEAFDIMHAQRLLDVSSSLFAIVMIIAVTVFSLLAVI